MSAEFDNDKAAGKSVNSPYQLDENLDSDAALREIKTAGGLSISPELFEKLYLSPKNTVTNNLRTTFANPTPLYALPPYHTAFVRRHDRDPSS